MSLACPEVHFPRGTAHILAFVAGNGKDLYGGAGMASVFNPLPGGNLMGCAGY
jgi:hypothetical protein